MSTQENEKLERISERVYNASFLVAVFVILMAVVVTGLIRYLSGNVEFELVPTNVFEFVERILWVFVMPITVKLVGDRLPMVLQIVLALRGISAAQPVSEPAKEEPKINFPEVQNGNP
jgi:hypothetical protein